MFANEFGPQRRDEKIADITIDEASVLREALNVASWVVDWNSVGPMPSDYGLLRRKLVKELFERKFLELPSELERVEQLTADVLKNILRKNHLPLKGNKLELAERVAEGAREDVLEILESFEMGKVTLKTSEAGREALKAHEYEKARIAEDFNIRFEKRFQEIRGLLKDRKFKEALEVGNAMYNEGLVLSPPRWQPLWLAAVSDAKPKALSSLDENDMEVLRFLVQLRLFGFSSYSLSQIQVKSHSLEIQKAKRLLEDCAERIREFRSLSTTVVGKPLRLVREPGADCVQCVKFAGGIPNRDVELSTLPSESCSKPDGCYLRVEAPDVVSEASVLDKGQSSPGLVPRLRPGDRLRDAKKLLDEGLIQKDVYDEVYSSVIEELKRNPS